MSTTTDPIAAASTMPEREWIRVDQACQWSGICRSLIYKLMTSGKIRSVSLRERGTSRGTRLISFPSLRAFLESKAEGGAP